MQSKMGVIVLPMLREKRNYGIINQEKMSLCKVVKYIYSTRLDFI